MEICFEIDFDAHRSAFEPFVFPARVNISRCTIHSSHQTHPLRSPYVRDAVLNPGYVVRVKQIIYGSLWARSPLAKTGQVR